MNIECTAWVITRKYVTFICLNFDHLYSDKQACFNAFVLTDIGIAALDNYTCNQISATEDTLKNQDSEYHSLHYENWRSLQLLITKSGRLKRLQ